LGELSLPVKVSSARSHARARQAYLLQYSSAGPASCCYPALQQHVSRCYMHGSTRIGIMGLLVVLSVHERAVGSN
jgi:hypothetical protein